MLIGDVSVTDVVVTPILLTFTIPPGTEGAKDIIITNPGGELAIVPSGYKYNPFPTIKLVRGRWLVPNEGPLAGGTQVTITGANFISGARIVIGDEQVVELDLFSSTELRFRTPAGTAGPKTVWVINPDGQGAMVKQRFTYNSASTIITQKR